MGKQKLPKPPDAKDTAAQQTQSNIDTAIAQTNLNNVSQVTPFGSLTYDVVGTNADGTPKYKATQSYSEPVQGIVDNSLGAILSNNEKIVEARQSISVQTAIDIASDIRVRRRINRYALTIRRFRCDTE